MHNHPNLQRRAFLQVATTLVISSDIAVAATSDEKKRGLNSASISDDAITLHFDARMFSSVVCRIGGPLTRLSDPEASEVVTLKNGDVVTEFKLISVREGVIQDMHGAGKSLQLTGISASKLEKQLCVKLYDRYPGFAVYSVAYVNRSDQAIVISSWRNGQRKINSAALGKSGEPGFWCYSGATYEDRRDWVQSVKTGFTQPNFMGMSASDYGGGTPIVDVWRPDCGVALGHLETTPKIVSLPIAEHKRAAHIAMSYERDVTLQPGATLNTLLTFTSVHRGDYFKTLDTYRLYMADAGIKAPRTPSASYEPIWCAWGYERNFTMQYVEGTLAKAKEIGLEWAVIDDGWQTANGDWYVDVKKFPRGEEDLKQLAKTIRAAGMKPKLWFSPLAVGPGTDLMHDHTDMLLLNKDGALQQISWWNSFYLCPAYPETITYTKKLIKKMLGEWGFEGLKIDGQHLNGVAPCYNPAHHHAYPEESVEKLQDFYKAMYDTAMEINPEAVVEVCPCGTSYAFFNMPYMNQAPASDPESSWQVRHKGKTLKALMGPSAPYAGDHVELSENGQDFASTVGIGAVVSTKFTWPLDPKPKDSFLLTPEHEVLWKKWVGLYKEKMLPSGTYRGELYDIGFDKPEAHVVEKNGRNYYAFYSPKWSGKIAIRGLPAGKFLLRDYFNDRDLGFVTNDKNQIAATFDHFLLIEAIPI